MQIETHKNYEKAWAKLNKKQQQKALSAIKLYITEPHNSRLRLHQLKGRYHPHYSISAGGDLRVHFMQLSDGHIVLMITGTHSQLY